MWNRLKNLFIPCEGNEYAPNFLQRMSVGVIFFLILLSFALANLQSILWVTSDWMVSSVLPSVLVQLTNDQRNEQALNSLVVSKKLTEAATLKAKDMAAKEYFAHYSPSGKSPWYWFDQVSYNFVHAGENLAVHFTDSDAVVKAWMNSPEHRANILDKDFTQIGIGTARGEYQGYPTIFVVQLFGTPAQAAVATAPATPQVLGSETNATNTASSGPSITLEKVTDSQASTSESGSSTEIAQASFKTFPIEKSSSSASTSGSTLASASSSTGLAAQDVVVTSDFATTSRAGVPAAIDPNDVVPDKNSLSYTNIFAHGALVPSIWLQVFYSGLALLVVFALILSIFIEWRRQHPLQIMYGTGLLAVMVLLFYIHVSLTSGATII